MTAVRTLVRIGGAEKDKESPPPPPSRDLQSWPAPVRAALSLSLGRTRAPRALSPQASSRQFLAARGRRSVAARGRRSRGRGRGCSARCRGAGEAGEAVSEVLVLNE